jgi:hypothetical protein
MTMRHERLSLAVSEEKRVRLLIVSVLSILCLSQAAFAQSGRRQSKNISPSPPVIVEPKTEGEAKPPTAKPAPIASLIVGGDRDRASFDIPSGYLDIAIDSCIERLGKSASLTVVGGGSMTRKEAIDKAKKQEDAYVVWLEMSVENDNSASAGIILGYTILIPQTAKVKTFGHVYLDRAQVGTGNVGVGLPPSASRRLPLDYLLKQGGRDVADRVMDIFHVGARN